MYHTCHLKCVIYLFKIGSLCSLAAPGSNYVGKADFELDPPASVSWVWGLLVYATSSLIFHPLHKHFDFSLLPMTLTWGVSPPEKSSAVSECASLICPALGTCFLLQCLSEVRPLGIFID